MSLLLDALKKAAEEKENNKAGAEEVNASDNKVTEKIERVPEIDEQLVSEEETVAAETEEDFDLELPELDMEEAIEVEEAEEENQSEELSANQAITDKETTSEHVAVAESEPEQALDLTEGNNASTEELTPEVTPVQQTEIKQAPASAKDTAEIKAKEPLKQPDYQHSDARKILEVSQKRYRNNQRLAYYGLYVFAAILFFSGSYLYYTAEILDNSDKLTFKKNNKTRVYEKTAQEKKIEQQVAIAKTKLAEIDNSKNKNSTAKVIKKKVTRPVVKKPKTISITKTKKEDPISVLLQKAYKHYQAAEYIQSDTLYKQVLIRDSKQHDALLGVAAIAVVNKDVTLAKNYYQQLLRYYPGDSIATSALVDLAKQQTTVASESQLKLLLHEDPDAAHVHFSLGLLYANQGRVKESQQAFFDAFARDKKADYAYNLAVMLDKLGQQKAALSYYKQASDLSDKGVSHFNEKLALERIMQLEGKNE